MYTGLLANVWGSLSTLETLALDTASKEKVESYMLTYAREKNYDYINTPEDFSKFTIDDLEAIARAYTSPNELFSLLQGAGLGMGGLWLMTADIPLLISLNCRMLAQLAWIFGIDCNKQPNVILQFLAAGVAHVLDKDDVVELPEEFYGKEDSAICEQLKSVQDQRDCVSTLSEQETKHEAGKQALQGLAQEVVHEIENGVRNEIVKHVSFTLGAHFARSKLLQFIPVVGMAVGAGTNYYYTSTNAEVATHLLKKKYLIDKHSLKHLTELYEKQFMDEWEFINVADIPDNYECVGNCCKASTLSGEDVLSGSMGSSFCSNANVGGKVAIPKSELCASQEEGQSHNISYAEIARGRMGHHEPGCDFEGNESDEYNEDSTRK